MNWETVTLVYSIYYPLHSPPYNLMVIAYTVFSFCKIVLKTASKRSQIYLLSLNMNKSTIN